MCNVALITVSCHNKKVYWSSNIVQFSCIHFSFFQCITNHNNFWFFLQTFYKLRISETKRTDHTFYLVFTRQPYLSVAVYQAAAIIVLIARSTGTMSAIPNESPNMMRSRPLPIYKRHNSHSDQRTPTPAYSLYVKIHIWRSNTQAPVTWWSR